MDTDRLTREQVLSMEPGRELDKLVALHVMGWTMYHYDKDVEENCYWMLVDDEFEPVAEWESYNIRTGERKTEDEAWNDCPNFSGSISAAFEVVEKMPMPFKILKSYQETFGVGPIGWIVNWCDNYADCGCHLDGDNCHAGKSVWAETAPLAICRAALLAVMEG